MPKTLNLINATEKTNRAIFLAKIKAINEIIIKFKKDEVINDFNEHDRIEAGRGNSYAVFEELNNTNITLESIRNGLKKRGVNDTTLQNKALALLLQGKAGIQYALGNVLNSLFLENDHGFLMKPDYEVTFEVKAKDHIKLIFSAAWHNLQDKDHNDAFKAQVEVDITPNKVAIRNFYITDVANDKKSNSAFSFLKSHQASILERFIRYLKSFFSASKVLDIENVATDKMPWNANTKKHEEVPIQQEELDNDEPNNSFKINN